MTTFFTENGPYTFQGGDAPVANEKSWHLFANMLYLDSPSTAGFSICSEDCIYSDDMVVSETLDVMMQFYAKFPEIVTNELYVTGNFYGGVTVPKIAKGIHDYNQGMPETPVPLKGMMINNGITDLKYDGAQSAVEMSYYRGFLDTATWDMI